MEVHQIAFFGATNSGKSTLVNAIAGQQVSLVSELPGTTTDPVRKRIEIPGLGACLLVDTAGYGDDGALGEERERLTRAVIDSTDVAVLLRSGHEADPKWEALLQKAGVPVVTVERRDLESLEKGESLSAIIRRIAAALPQEDQKYLTGSLVAAGDLVLLVMPQDSEAPKGRLILPQVQVIRELLDRGCNAVCTTPESLPTALKQLSPSLVITDSQVFKYVNETIPSSLPLTSFSILLAAAKGDIRTFVDGTKRIGTLKDGDRVLIAEACTHVPDTEDIGRVKIPKLLRKRADVTVDIAAGNDFPEDLSPYSLIIHCGACVATAALVRSRIRKALLAGVPITNYGIALAELQGILPRVSIP